MTAAGVQNIDSTAYLPPPPSTSSTADAKGTSAAGKQGSAAQGADPQGQASDFQSELESQQTGKQDTEQAGSPKTGSGKPGKKREDRPDDTNPAAVPVQVADPQKQILPFLLALPQPEVNAKLDGNANTDKKNTPDEDARTSTISQEPSQPAGPALPAITIAPQPVEPGQPASLKQPAAFKPSAKFRPSMTSAEAPPIPAANAESSPTPDSSKAPPLVSGLPPAPQLPLPEGTTKSVSSSPLEQDQNQTAASVQPGASSNQPASQVELNLPATPAEPVTTAVQQAVDSAPSRPSALAFAARLAAPAQKTVEPAAVKPSQSSSVAASQTPAQIPVRYPATAQILQNGPGTEQDEAKKDTGVSIDRAARPDVRTDTVVPRFETVSEPAPRSGSAAPQMAQPAARTESVIEPPAAPPTSSHDIRVRVPDNNGGSTQVRFVESGGEVRVSVRTADEGLAQNLRTHLNDLTQRLSDGGTPAEIWKPASSAASSSQNDQHQPSQDGRGSGGQGSGGQNGQQDRQQRRPAWLEEMEASLHAE